MDHGCGAGTVTVSAARNYLKATSPRWRRNTFRTATRVRAFGVGEDKCLVLMMLHWNGRSPVPWSRENLEQIIADAYHPRTATRLKLQKDKTMPFTYDDDDQDAAIWGAIEAGEAEDVRDDDADIADKFLRNLAASEAAEASNNAAWAEIEAKDAKEMLIEAATSAIRAPHLTLVHNEDEDATE